jgi:5'-3' exonuclease
MEHTFKERYGISPKRWIAVKALAGCNTDNIPGITGVGEASAVKYLRGNLKESSIYYRRIEEGIAQGILQTNRALVKLPFEGTPVPELRVDDDLNWGPTMKRLGIRTLDPEPGYYKRKNNGQKKTAC